MLGSQSNKVMGVDLSSSITGYCIMEDSKIIESGVIELLSWNSQNTIKNWNIFLNFFKNKLEEGMLLVVELSNFINPWITNRFHRIFGWIETIAYLKKCSVKSVSPNEWRQYIFDKIHKMEREELKQLAIDKVKELYEIVVSNDEAEAILIALVSHRIRTLEEVNNSTKEAKQYNKKLKRDKEKARLYIEKMKSVKKLSITQEAKLHQYKQILKMKAK